MNREWRKNNKTKQSKKHNTSINRAKVKSTIDELRVLLIQIEIK